jgi:hypothetical protein
VARKKSLPSTFSPVNLWGKPLPSSLAQKPKEEEAVLQYEDDNEDIDDDALEAEMAADDYEEEAADEAEENVADGTDDDDFAPEDGDEVDSETIVAESDDDDDDDEADAAEVEPIGASVVSDEDDDGDVTAPVTKKKGFAAMANTGGKKNISDHVRDEISRRQESGDSLRGVDIVTALAAKKIAASPAMVSQLLKKAGVAQKARGPRKAKPAAAATEERSRTAHKAAATTAKRPAARTVPSPAPSGKLRLPMAQLQAAEAFVTACGGFKQAERILTLAAQFAE